MLFLVELSVTIVTLFVSALLVSYIVFEEDSLFDLSDFNVVHVFLLVLTLASVCVDNASKATWGAWVDADRGVFFYALFKSLSLVLYFGVIWLVFFKHAMAPLLIDDVDDGYAFLSCAEALGSSGVLCVLFLVVLNAMGHVSSSAGLRGLPLWCLTSFLGVVTSCVILVNIFYEAPSSAVAPSSGFSTSPSSYTGSGFGVVGGFDWHVARSIPTTLLFIEFICQLWLLLAALVVVGISFFAILTSLFMGTSGDDADEGRIVGGWLSSTLATGQLLAVLVVSLLLVNFSHDVALMAMGGLSAE